MPTTIKLDERRGHAELKATEVRRELQAVEADHYLTGLLAATLARRDPRRKALIANVLDDMSCLTGGDGQN